MICPSDVSFAVAVITPRWLYVLAAATGIRWGDPHVVDETLAPVDPADVLPARGESEPSTANMAGRASTETRGFAMLNGV